MKSVATLAFIFLAGCSVTQKQELGGEATARVVFEFPAAQACFDDERIETFEQLKICLELTTNSRYTVDASGAIIDSLMGDATTEEDAGE